MKINYLKKGVLNIRSWIDFVKAEMIKLGIKNYHSVKYMKNPFDFEKLKFYSYLSNSI